jgi:hypothetical protein
VERRPSRPPAVHLRLYNLLIRLPRPRTVLAKALYWLAVLVISLALLVLLVLFFESRDSSDLENSQNSAGPGSVIVLRS